MSQLFPDIKRVCIFGVGGVGGYFGGRFAERIDNCRPYNYQVYFIARGEHLRAIKNHGIKVITPERVITGIPTKATNDISETPPFDLLLLCVKAYDLDEAVESINSKICETTTIIPLLNGVDIYERIRMKLKKGIVLPACIYIGTHIERPGVINQNGGSGRIIFGRDPQFPQFEGQTVKTFFKDMGIPFVWQNDPFPAIWEKYLFISAFGLVSASTGSSLGQIMENMELRDQVRSIMGEIISVAKKKSVVFPENSIEQSLKKASSFPYETRSSYQRDVENKGKNNEGDLYGGTIIREGAALGIPTPMTESVYKIIQRLN
ncbi:ketopantoate reductase family protein [Chloroflexota bacterium]